MAIGIYFHIPYCVQRCPYCDFATYEKSQILPPEEYVPVVIREMRQRHLLWQDREVRSIYFGGGTPSLIPAELIVTLIEEVANLGFHIMDPCEITLEINPATLDKAKLNLYRAGGVNRFSVGAQTFNDRLLTRVGRKHSSQDIHDTLALLTAQGLSYSFDLLFGLPEQTLNDFEEDLQWVLQYQPPHLSAYVLTIAPENPLNQGRLGEATEVKMFDRLTAGLEEIGLRRYEISNYAVPGHEAIHNSSYWSDHEYWGVGLSSHSYRHNGPWGERFWNTRQLTSYMEEVRSTDTKSLVDQDLRTTQTFVPEGRREELSLEASLSDYCHTHLRTMRGLSRQQLYSKYPERITDEVNRKMTSLQNRGLVKSLDTPDLHWSLTDKGVLLSNLVFEEFVWAKGELTVKV